MADIQHDPFQHDLGQLRGRRRRHRRLRCTMTITNSTISGTRLSRTLAASSRFRNANAHSTITLNRQTRITIPRVRGGVFVASGGQATLDHTIVAGNLRSTSTRTISPAQSPHGIASSATTLCATITNNGGNQIGTGSRADQSSARAVDLQWRGDVHPRSFCRAARRSRQAIWRQWPEWEACRSWINAVRALREFADGDGAGGAQIDIVLTSDRRCRLGCWLSTR